MKKAIALRWAKALKSGKYKQAKGVLHERDGGYCCLGVLCELYAKEEGRKVVWRERGSSAMGFFRKDGEFTNLPDTVRLWAGMKDDSGTIDESIAKGAIPNSLVEANDDLGWGFKKIGNFVEKHYKAL